MKLRLYSDSVLRPILRRELSKEDYDRVSERLKDCPKVDAVPEGFITHYAMKHESEFEEGIHRMLRSFHNSSGGCENETNGE